MVRSGSQYKWVFFACSHFVSRYFANADEPDKLERLCRYISRPAISEQRLSMTDHGKVRYELKTPYREGTTHVFFDPLDFIGKLSALIPPPRLNLTRFFGVFAPNSNLRARVTASQRGKNSHRITNQGNEQSDKPYQAKSMTWAQRLKRICYSTRLQFWGIDNKQNTRY
jgi:hypothetical protein